MPTLIFDIEADGFLYEVSTIWCLVAYEVETQTYHIYHVDTEEEVCYPKKHILHNINSILSLLSTSTIVGHNIYSYDLPVLSKLYSFQYTPSVERYQDTIIMSRLFYPDRDGHSLEDWGERLKYSKGGHTDFSRFSKEMLTYCIRDVDITYRTWLHLKEEAGDWDWSRSLLLEYSMQHIQTKQETNGVLFDKDKAETLLAKIQLEIADIEAKVIPAIPQKVVDMGEVRKPFLKSGEYSEITKRWLNV
jgi:DNA polymerase I